MSILGTSATAGNDLLFNPLQPYLEPSSRSRRQLLKERAARYKVGTAALVILIIGLVSVATLSVVSSAQLSSAVAAARRLPVFAQPTKGPNRMVANADLSAAVGQITNQPLSINVGASTTSFSQATISGWLATANDRARGVTYLHVNQAKIAADVSSALSAYNVSPVNQVTVTHGSTSQVIVAGRSGSSVGSPASVIKQIGQQLLSGKGMHFNLPLNTLSAQALTPANFDKLIEIDVNLKQMYIYQNGQQIQQYAVDAGGPQTPTPIGEFHILYKLPLQTMTGFNPNGTRYVQPNVQWINYFYQGDAIHGNYWVPAWHFGEVNSSHGCVSVPDNEAEWIYNWAPVGTTVITHT